MGLEGEPRVAAAKRWLQSRLEEAFSKTAFDCRSLFSEFQYPPVTTGEGDPVVRQAVREFRERSLECIREGFGRLLEVIRTLQHDTGDDLADLVKKLTWEAIDETFWPAGDRSNPSRFQDWTTQAEANFWVQGGVPMISPECNTPNSSLADQLNCDFRTQVGHLLNMLRDEAFSNIPSAQSTDAAPTAAVVDPDAPEPYVDDPQLDSDDPEVRTLARARLVGRIRKELAYFRTELEGKTAREEIEQLALQHPEHAMFVRRSRKLLLLSDRCWDLLKGKKVAYAALAYEIAAAKDGHVGASVMKKAWTKHPELHDFRAVVNSNNESAH